MKSVEHAIFAHICSTLSYAFPQKYCFSLFTQMLPILKSLLTSQEGKGRSPTLLAPTHYKLYWDSRCVFLSILRCAMSSHFYLENHAPSLVHSRCSFLNEIINILKILSLMLNFTAIHLLCISTLMINQLIISLHKFCAY